MKSIIAALALFFLPLFAYASDAAAAHSDQAAPHEEHALPLYAEQITHIGPLPISNSMIVSWIVALGVILFARIATRRMQLVPAGAQNFWEWLVESLYEFLAGIIGNQLVKKTFWFFATTFIFILAANYAGLVPGIGTVGYYTDGGKVFHPYFRGANADLNLTLAMSCVFFVLWFIWALQANGPGGFLLHLFGPKGDTTGALKVLMVIVFFAVGFLEIISILFRPVSLSLRLFGNIYAGEQMLETMSSFNVLRYVLPLPFYFMELIVGLVQAMVFMLLTAVFTLLICEQHEEGHEAAHH